MERPETAHQIGIVNYVLGEVWDLFDSEAMRHSYDTCLSEIN
jgi:hypothetical protein